MKTVLLVLLFLSTVSCSSVPLGKGVVRTKEYVITNTKSKESNFDKAQVWAAKGGGVMKLNDRKTGNIVIKANVECPALKLGNGYVTSDRVWFVLSVNADNNKVQTSFNEITATAKDAWDSGMRPSTQEELDAVSSMCLEPIKDQLQSIL